MRSIVLLALVEGASRFASCGSTRRALVAAAVLEHDEAVTVRGGLGEALLRHHHADAPVLRGLDEYVVHHGVAFRELVHEEHAVGAARLLEDAGRHARDLVAALQEALVLDALRLRPG